MKKMPGAMDGFAARLASGLRSDRYWLGSIFLAAISIAYVCISVWLIAPSYLVNDNIEIMDYAIHGLPIDFMGVLLTDLLHIAYTTDPDVPWFGLTLYALHVLSVFLWLRMIWQVFRPTWLAASLSVLFLGFYLSFLVYLDYTSTGVMLCLAGITWALLLVIRDHQGLLQFLGAGLVFMLGMLARPQTGYGALAYTASLALIVLLWRMRAGDLKAEARRLVIASLIFFIPAVTNLVGDNVYRHYTATPQQLAFDEFNAVRGKLQGLQRARSLAIINDRSLLASVGWTKLDAQNFFAWRFLDERVYTTAKLQKIVDDMPAPRLADSQMSGYFGRLTLGPSQLLLLCPLPLFLIAIRRRRMGALSLLLPLYGLSVGAFMSIFTAFRERTEMPFMVAFGLACLILGGAFAGTEKEDAGDYRGTLTITACLLGFTGMYLNLTGLMKEHKTTLELAQKTQAALMILNRDYAGSIVMVEPDGGLRLETLSPLEALPLRFHPIDMGWNTFSPRFYQEIRYLGIDHGYELIDTLVGRQDAYLLGNPWWAGVALNMRTSSMTADVRPLQVYQFSDNDRLFRYVVTDKH